MVNDKDEYKGYDIPLGRNHEYLVAKGILEDKGIIVKKSNNRVKTGKYRNKLLLDMKEYQERLRIVAKEEGEKHHTLAKQFIIAGIKRLEKKHKKEKFIEKKYSI